MKSNSTSFELSTRLERLLVIGVFVFFGWLGYVLATPIYGIRYLSALLVPITILKLYYMYRTRAMSVSPPPALDTVELKAKWWVMQSGSVRTILQTPEEWKRIQLVGQSDLMWLFERFQILEFGEVILDSTLIHSTPEIPKLVQFGITRDRKCNIWLDLSTGRVAETMSSNRPRKEDFIDYSLWNLIHDVCAGRFGL